MIPEELARLLQSSVLRAPSLVGFPGVPCSKVTCFGDGGGLAAAQVSPTLAQ